MTLSASSDLELPGEFSPADETTPPPENSSLERGRAMFVVWGIGSYLVVTAVLLALSLAVTKGVFVYLIDDPAIHLSIARTFAKSGTWGVVPGHFQSASSAPLWTLALSAFYIVAPFAVNVAPFLLNLLSSIVVIMLLARSQSVLLPSRSRLLDGPAVAGIVVAVLFLPALTMLGMEHVAHMAFVIAIVGLWTGVLPGSARKRLTRPLPLAAILLALATLVRFETVFVAFGLAVASLVPVDPDQRLRPDRERLRRAVVALTASGIPLVLFSSVNRALGQGWLPNSVLAKGQVVSGAAERSIAPLAILNRLTTDPMIVGLVTVTVVGLVLGWRRRSFVVPCVVFLTATALHVTFAGIGWFDRYQAYLIALGVFCVLRMASELSTEGLWSKPSRRVSRASVIALVALLLVGTKISLTSKVPMGVADTYRQRYQAGLFLERYYEGRSIATGELGYISLLRKGPITDLFGLGDFEVLEMRRSHNQQVPSELWEKLGVERGIEVVAVYPLTLWTDTPDNWILVGSWVLKDPTVTAFDPVFQFWATTPEEVAPLREHLVEFEPDMPDGVHLELDKFADLRAKKLSGG